MKHAQKSKTIAVIDAETDPFVYGRIPKPFIWGFATADTYKEFYSTESLYEYLRTLKKPHLVYAHNGGKFDFHYLLNLLRPQMIKIINGRIASFKIGKCEMRDSLLIIPRSLDSLGAGKLEIDYSLFEYEERKEHMPEIREYLKQDCYALLKVINRFKEEYGLSLTIAGAALNYYETNYSKVKRTTKAFYERIAPFYKGGRVQALKTGSFKKKMKYIDLNSAYPYVMKEKYHPSGTVLHHTRDIFKVPFDFPYFVEFEGYTHGAFPITDPVTKKTDYPTGKYTIKTSSWEYEQAIALDLVRVDKILNVFYTTEVTNFSGYVDHFYDIRKKYKDEGDKLGEQIAKLFLNSLYGKFGANPENYSDFYIDEYNNKLIENGWNIHTEIDDKKCLYSRPSSQRQYINVATAASITGAVRAMLMKGLHDVQNPVYCDTDSIICENTGDLTLGDALGEWDLEFMPKEAHIAGKKIYALRDVIGNEKISSKGFKASFNDVVRLVHGETINWKNDAPTFSLNKASFISRNIKTNS